MTVELGDRLRARVARELITRRGEGSLASEDEYVLRNALVREAAFAMLTEEDQALAHRLAGAWLSREGEHQAAVLADPFEREGDADRAIGGHQRAAPLSLLVNNEHGPRRERGGRAHVDDRGEALRPVVAQRARGSILGTPNKTDRF